MRTRRPNPSRRPRRTACRSSLDTSSGSRSPCASSLVDPQLLAGLRIERAEPAIVGRADEDQAAGRHRRTGAAAAAGVLLAFGQRLGDAERASPRRSRRCSRSPQRAGPTVDADTGRFAIVRPVASLQRRAEREVRPGAVHAAAIVGLRRARGAAAVVQARASSSRPTRRATCRAR